MSFPQAIARQQDAIFVRLGEDADWDGVGVVRVRRRDADENMALDRGALVEMGQTIKVRQSEVASPGIGQVVQILDDNGDPIADGMFQITAEPKLDRRKVWTCQVRPITA